MNFKLENANIKDIDNLIQYKLASIFDYATNLDDKETNKIKNYIINNVPKQIDEYKIIKCDEKVVGCLLTTNYEDGILLDEIYLVSEYRNKGIGSNILNNIIKNNNIVYLWVYKNNSKAIDLYNKINFKVIEETENRLFMKYEK